MEGVLLLELGQITMVGLFLIGTLIGVTIQDTIPIGITANGKVTAQSVGEAAVVVAHDDVTATRVISVQSNTPIVTTVDVNIHRLDTETGITLVSAGMPLRAGLVYPNTIEYFRLIVNNTEIPIFVQPLFGKHQDGSYRSVLIQFSMEVTAGQPVTGKLEFGPRGVRYNTRTDIIGSVESAVILPASSAYIISTQVIHPTIISSELPATQLYTRFDDIYRQTASRHIIQDGFTDRDSRQFNFYDRVLTSYVQWVRTGHIQYWVDATRLVRQYHAITNSYSTIAQSYAPWDYHPDGLFLSYLLTGDEKNRRILAEWALQNSRNLRAAHRNYIFNSYREGRPQQRVMLSALYSALLEDTSTDWFAVTDAYVTSWLDTQEPWHTQGFDGAWLYPLPDSLVGQSNFMEGLRLTALVTYLEYRNPSVEMRRRVEIAIKKQVDFLWNTQWQPQFQSFKYWSSDQVGRRSLADLNNLMVLGFAYVYHITGDIEYYNRTMQIISPAFLPQSDGWSVCWGCSFGKQFNQNYYSSWRVFYYLNSVR
jgi:hypothetical protein